MQKGVVIDCCTLGVLANPNEPQAKNECWDWAENLRRKGTLVRIPTIAIYECRRKLIQISSVKGIDKLDEMVDVFGRLQLSDEVMDLAACLWAKDKKGLGKGGVDDLRLDADVIICAEATIFARDNDVAVTVATDNVRHFQPLVDGKYLVGAAEWRKIQP